MFDKLCKAWYNKTTKWIKGIQWNRGGFDETKLYI